MRGASLLVYCVCETPREPPPAEIRGVDGQPVYLIDDDGLCVVVSPLPQPAGAGAPDVSRILAFEKVVEVFHRARAVLPFRFGCVLEDEMRAREALRARRGEYQAFLGRLNGCVEMGVRLLLPWKDRAPSGDGPGPHSAADGAAPAGTSPGIRYLHARRARYQEEERLALEEEEDETVERCRTAFTGLYVDFRSELSRIRGPGVRMASLVFLVKRDREEAFREAFRVLSRKEGTKILLSGPWPPYNFVTGEAGEK
ncbi:GvpL/GvpF family gas vesicle protein [Candidatus Deferrimicrobium sp.]|uniref:GvpL/GvpF family gas vesicle protein n=1 Tax=Candidatus Deferrimicrobium sp. TaxID=3060586 RepID=UPI00271799F7|nr:GvpL/GvpF family gas vesicle protein [Candidatus Deferrimicrobium sp.]MDO8738461.1 GvpL/GvpF family gas vesicle protein [Candidatus Deferrimicrobium sp.]